MIFCRMSVILFARIFFRRDIIFPVISNCADLSDTWMKNCCKHFGLCSSSVALATFFYDNRRRFAFIQIKLINIVENIYCSVRSEPCIISREDKINADIGNI